MQQQQGGFISIVASTSRMISECVSVRMRDTSTGWFAFHSWWLYGLCICQNEGNHYRVISTVVDYIDCVSVRMRETSTGWFDFHSGWLCGLCFCQNQGYLHRVICFPYGLCFCQNQGYLHRVILFPQWMDCVSVRIKDTSTGWFYFHSGLLCGLCLCQNQGYLDKVIWFSQWIFMWPVYLSEWGKPPQGDFQSGWLCGLCLCQNQGCIHRVISTVDGYVACISVRIRDASTGWFPQWMVMWTVFMSESLILPQGDFHSWLCGLYLCQNQGDLVVFTEDKPFIIVKYAQPLPVRAPGPVPNSSVQFNDLNYQVYVYISKLNSTIRVIRTTFPDKSAPPPLPRNGQC